MARSVCLVASLAAVIALIGAPALPAADEPRTGQAPPRPQTAEDVTAEMTKILVPAALPDVDDHQAAGLPRTSHPYVLTFPRAYALALLRARAGGHAPADGAAGALSDEQKRLLEQNRPSLPDFAAFRQDFLSGGAPFRDPAPRFYELLRQRWRIEADGRAVAAADRLGSVVRELARGEASGITSATLAETTAALQRARLARAESLAAYRDMLDELKVELGLPADLAVIPDPAPLAKATAVLDAFSAWVARPDRSSAELDGLIRRFPALEDVAIGGRPFLKTLKEDPDQLASFLTAAVQSSARKQAQAGAAARPNADPQQELRIRRQVRRLALLAERYEGQTRLLVRAMIAVDEVHEELVAPPQPSAPSRARSSLPGLIPKALESDRALLAAGNAVLETWVQFQMERLELYRSLGALPYDDWPSFLQSLTAGAPPPGPDRNGRPAGKETPR